MTTTQTVYEVKMPNSGVKLVAEVKLQTETVTLDYKVEPKLKDGQYIFKLKLEHPGCYQFDVMELRNSGPTLLIKRCNITKVWIYL